MPHKEEKEEAAPSPREFTPNQHPEFPDGFPTVALETISLAKLLIPKNKNESGDGGEAERERERERDRVFEACKGRGFFYLDLTGCAAGETISRGADRAAAVAEDVFRLTLEEKMVYRLEAGGGSLDGYKVRGATLADPSGVKDTAEFFNVGKNEMILPEDQMKKNWPEPIMASKALFKDYIETAHGIGLSILGILATKLGVDPAEFDSRHRIEEQSGDHVRLTRGPPREKEELPEIQTPSHTDFGTITILMNWLGGLQVWSESSRRAELLNHEPDVPGEWLWVKPKKGCAIVNLGDAAVKFTNGVLCAGRHRVIPAPGVQGKYPRYSIVYFVRPENQCIMKQFRGPGIPDGPEEEELITAGEWIKKQATGLGIQFRER
ncbi:Clavaminate synthase-like protein [Nemania serpens]|nr:Clavaminate synthase-like protein [Nemania serpens]